MQDFQSYGAGDLSTGTYYLQVKKLREERGVAEAGEPTATAGSDTGGGEASAVEFVGGTGPREARGGRRGASKGASKHAETRREKKGEKNKGETREPRSKHKRLLVGFSPNENGKNRKGAKGTAPGLPTWSPTVVLTWPDAV